MGELCGFVERSGVGRVRGCSVSLIGLGSGLGRVAGGLLLLAHQTKWLQLFCAASVSSVVMDPLTCSNSSPHGGLSCFIVVPGSSVYCGLWHTSFV